MPVCGFFLSAPALIVSRRRILLSYLQYLLWIQDDNFLRVALKRDTKQTQQTRNITLERQSKIAFITS